MYVHTYIFKGQNHEELLSKVEEEHTHCLRYRYRYQNLTAERERERGVDTQSKKQDRRFGEYLERLMVYIYIYIAGRAMGICMYI